MTAGPNNAQATRPFKPSRRSAEEDRAWARVYGDVGQASVAEELVKQLDADPEAKRCHLALYLRAKATLRKRKAVEARNQRIGAFVRLLVSILVIGPARWLRWMLSGSVDVAVEILPPARDEPAKARVPALKKDLAFANASERFTSGPTAAGAESEASRGVKAA